MDSAAPHGARLPPVQRPRSLPDLSAEPRGQYGGSSSSSSRHDASLPPLPQRLVSSSSQRGLSEVRAQIGKLKEELKGHPGYVPLSKRCDITADVFKRYGYAEAHKKPALQEVLKEMRRPTEDCTGLQKGPWMASVERLRNAQSRKSGGLDARPVPSWNFRFGAGISSDPAPLPPPPPVRVPPPGEANMGPLPRQPPVTQEARRLERPPREPARRPSGQGQEEAKKRLGRKEEAEVDPGQRPGAKVKRPCGPEADSKPSREGSQRAVKGSKKPPAPQAAGASLAASPAVESEAPHADVPSDPPAPGDEQKAPAQGQSPEPASEVPSGPVEEPKPPTPSFGRGASCSSVEELRTEPRPLAREEETLPVDTTARPHEKETLLLGSTGRPQGEQTLPGGTTAKTEGEESGSSSQEPPAPGPPSPDAHLVACEEPQPIELPAASSPGLDEEATGDCGGEAQAQEAPT